ncbi:urease accessory protein UreD [Caldilinea aerophila]|uniref:urease accessory protein UreD n=1 Tax=Caldilinea aerophila TaxID=133453 RepID=UPI0013966BE2|nr:urease accessory protein UreD [Caldilinea aerophila]
MHLHNISGGVLGGDELTMEVIVEPGAYAQLTTTGATRLYRPRKHSRPALQQTWLHVSAGGLLEYLPDPIIPFACARYRQQTCVFLEENAGFFGWEVVTPGREASGERFAYTLLEMDLTIQAIEPNESAEFPSLLPIALERVRLELTHQSLGSPLRLGLYSYYANFYACRVGVSAARWRELEEQLFELAESLSQAGQCIWGVSTLVAHGISVRGMASQSRALLQNLPRFWQKARCFLYGTSGTMPRKLY